MDNIDLTTQSQEKIFTKEEVNRIVQERLARDRKAREAEQDSVGMEKSITDREKALEERELKLMAREKLMDEGLPIDLADILSYSDEKTLEEVIDKIKKINGIRYSGASWGERISGGTSRSRHDSIREAMGLNR